MPTAQPLNIRLKPYRSIGLAAILSAFLGAFIGNRLMKKVTLRTIQVLVAIMLLGIAVALGTGVI